MREESHLDDMRAAIRGDFERLAERRGAQELMRDADALSDADAPEPHAAAPPAQDEATAGTAHSVEPEPKPEPEHEPEREPERSWLARLLGR